MDSQLSLVGTWRLIAIETRWVSGRTGPGPYDDGYLLYTPDGYMCGVLTKGPRAPFGTESLRSGTTDEKARAFDSYWSYGGSYAVNGDVVTHRVLFCQLPDWVGTTQVRRFALGAEGDTLTLSTINPVLFQGEETYSYLTWRRAEAMGAAGDNCLGRGQSGQSDDPRLRQRQGAEIDHTQGDLRGR